MPIRASYNFKDSATSAGKFTFSEHHLNTGHVMRPKEENMTFYILKTNLGKLSHRGNPYLKATISDNMLNLMQSNNPPYKI